MTKHPETARMLALPLGIPIKFKPPANVSLKRFRERLRQRLQRRKARLYFWRTEVEGDSILVVKVAKRALGEPMRMK